MKNNVIKTMYILFAAMASANAKAQTLSDFENLTLQPDSYWNGSSQPMGAVFYSGNAEFPCFYDTSFGGFWSSGWAYSNVTDTGTAGSLNQYSARTGSGFYGSPNYVVAQQNAFAQSYPVARLTGNAAGKIVEGFYVTNGTYPYLSMRDGDSFGKQFGSPNDASGSPDGTNGEDWFLLTIKKWHNGTLGADSVNFYLADFRFANNSQDYIVDTWQWVDLTSLGNADSLLFTLTSSDTGPFGMNTPAFFCMDDFTTRDAAVSVSERNDLASIVSVYPNPASEFIKLNRGKTEAEIISIRIYDNMGKLAHEETTNESNPTVRIAPLSSGLYRVVLVSDEIAVTRNFIKQ